MKKRPEPAGFVSDGRFQVVFLSLFALAVFFSKLGLNGMANYDDCFYAEKAKEILQSGNWWILTFNHEPAFENPPLFMWLIALSYKVFGVSVYAAKFPSALAGSAAVLLIYFLGRFLFNQWTGFFAAFVLATTYPFFKYGRHAMLDVTLSFFVCLALLAFLLALRKDRRYFLLWGLCLGAGILIKSVLGFFPVVISVIFLLLTRKWKKILDPYFAMGCLVAIVLGGSWYWVETATFGQKFLQTHFGWLVLSRGVRGTGEPWFYHLGYFRDLAIFYWPWLPLLAFGTFLMLRLRVWKNESVLFTLLWAGTYLAVMSAMGTRMLWYIMPAFPAFALIAGYAMNHLLSAKGRFKAATSIAVFGIVAIVLMNFLPMALDRDREKDTRILAPYVRYYAEKGAKVVALREEYYGLNNALLFFSDYAARPLYPKVEDLAKAFESKDLVLCLAHKGDVADLKKSGGEWYQVKSGEDMILIANQPLDTSDVRTWGGLWEK